HPRRRDLLRPPARGGRLVAVAEARQRGDDDVERGRGGIARLRQFVHHVDELGDAARPTVGHDQRNRVRARRAPVQEVDPQAVDRRAELADRGEPVLEPPPVVAGAPVVDYLDEVGERDTLVPPVAAGALDRLGLREPGRRQPGAQVVEFGIGGAGGERLHVAGWTGHGTSWPSRSRPTVDVNRLSRFYTPSRAKATG